ncbi:MAG: hypothetical protein AABX53_00965 [Nanoarchaeota archaeon]
MHKKGQAAMEFLMTYGWAILAAIIAIGVLAYFGVFSPGKYTTGSTVVNPPFYANSWNVQANVTGSSGIILELRNNGGENFEVQSIDVTNCGTFATPTTIATGELQPFTIDCTGVLTEGTSFKGDITITYLKTDSTVVLTSTGTIAEKVTA